MTAGCSPTPSKTAKNFWKSQRDREAWALPSPTNSTASSTFPSWAEQAREAAAAAEQFHLRAFTLLCWMAKRQCHRGPMNQQETEASAGAQDSSEKEPQSSGLWGV